MCAAVGICVHVQSALNSIRGACTYIMPLLLTLPIIVTVIAAATTHGSILADEQRWLRNLGSRRRYRQRNAPSSSTSTAAARVFRLDDVEEEDEIQNDEDDEEHDDNPDESEDASLLRS